MPNDSVTDLSAHVLVLAADSDAYDRVLRPAVHTASLADGRALVPLRVDPGDPLALGDDEALDVLEHGAVLLADLVGMAPSVFSLVAWHARARSASTVLLRHGSAALPFELHEFPVRSYEPKVPDLLAASRVRAATLVTTAAAGRAAEGPRSVRWTHVREAAAHRVRREKRGVLDALFLADRDCLEGNLPGALFALQHALASEPEAPDLLLRAALLHRTAGQYPDAVRLLERAVHVAPERASAWRELGICRDRSGADEAREALERAVELADDYEALVALALLHARDGGRDAEPARLLERAMEVSGGQLNLAVPALIFRAGREGRVRLVSHERARVEQVLAIRRGQALAQPPEDAPWSHFDAARAHLLLDDLPSALELVRSARPHLHASWNTTTFARSLDALERAGVDVQPIRDELGLERRTTAPVSASAPPSARPFRAAARGPSWFVENVPCMSACPVGTDAGAYVHWIAQGRLEEAFHALRGPNPFASVCGRVCAAPCEDACRRGRIDEPVAIRPLKRFVTERFGVEAEHPRIEEVLVADRAPCIEGDAYASHLMKMGGRPRGTGPRVLVVGGGPAGLACAHDLAVLGYRVTVCEATDQLGGMVRHGIPAYRLPRDVLEREIAAIVGLGVEVRLTSPLDRERNLARLRDEEGYEAVFLASGAGRGRFLDVEGAELDGVVRAIEYLINENRGYRIDLGRRVAVVGGGNVALDVARTARRGRPPDRVTTERARADARADLGPHLPGHILRRALGGEEREVHVIARQPMGAWPAERSVHGIEELQEARREGIVFHPLRGLRRILGEGGRVTGVELAEVVQVRDAEGRYAPVYGAHAAETIRCDTVFLAVGQEPELDYLEGTSDVRRTRGGLIEVDPETLETRMPGVWAGGDAAFGPRTLIEAVADGKRAARGIHARLGRAFALRRHVRFTEMHPRAVPTEPGYDAIGREAPPATALDRRTGIAEVEGAYDDETARRQAARCLVCHVQTVYDGRLCIACGRCTDVCPYACLTFARPEDTDVVGELARDLPVPEGDGPLVWMLKDEDRCIRCGLCAERCPTGAMTMEHFEMAVEEEPV